MSKRKLKFPLIKGNSEGSSCKVIYSMTNGLLIQYMVKYLRILYILGSPSSHMTLQPLPSEFPNIYKESFIFCFISVYRVEFTANKPTLRGAI